MYFFSWLVISDEDNYTPENYVQEFVSDDPVGNECLHAMYFAPVGTEKTFKDF